MLKLLLIFAEMLLDFAEILLVAKFWPNFARIPPEFGVNQVSKLIRIT